MSSHIYKLGYHTALIKLGMPLTFDNPAEAQEHARRRQAVGQATGALGNIAGGIAGARYGGRFGIPGMLASTVAGSLLGRKAVQIPAVSMYDAAHSVPQTAKSQYRSTMSRMNTSAGMPAGVGRDWRYA
jgi:hypothetical protein